MFPQKQEFTFNRPGKASSRLDRFYIPSSYTGPLNICHLASLSDHCAVFLQIEIDAINFSAGMNVGRNTYWKLNTSILNDEEFLPSFSSFWSQITKSQAHSIDIAEWWDKQAKPAVKQFCISFSQHRKSKRRDKVRFLLSYLKIVLKEKNWCEVARTKEDLKNLKLMYTEDVWDSS